MQGMANFQSKALNRKFEMLAMGTLAGARAGSGNYSLVITGRSAHAGRNPQDGRNAIVAAAALTLGLKALEGEEPMRACGGEALVRA